ncbi:hypothetical protein ACVR05_07165 [Streptococcus caprae]|uniref:Uncharacterized protein n=1 Tax=Streptococcus caprae TaxID=1640501 RepID=A0ABV8CW03_9STRE
MQHISIVSELLKFINHTKQDNVNFAIQKECLAFYSVQQSEVSTKDITSVGNNDNTPQLFFMHFRPAKSGFLTLYTKTSHL